MQVLDVVINGTFGRRNRDLHPKSLGGMRLHIIRWKQQMEGAVPVLCLHATVFTATNEQQIRLPCIGCYYKNVPKSWMCQRAMQ